MDQKECEHEMRCFLFEFTVGGNTKQTKIDKCFIFNHRWKHQLFSFTTHFVLAIQCDF